MKRKRSISGLNLLCWISTIVLVGVCFMVFFIYQRRADFARNERLLKLVQERMIDEFLDDRLSDALPIVAKMGKDGSSNSMIEVVLSGNRADTSSSAPQLREVYVFGRDLSLVRCPDDGVLSKHLKGESGRRILESIQDKALPGHSVSGEELLKTSSGENIRVKWRAAACRGFPWTVVAAKNMRAIDSATLGNVNRMKIDMALDIGYIFLLMLIVVLVAIRFAYLIAGDIRREVKSLTDLCESGLGADPGKLPGSYKFEEFSIISKAIRTMSEQISGLLEELKTAAVKSSVANQIQSGVLSSITHNLIGKLNNIMGVAQVLHEKEAAKVGHDEPETEVAGEANSIIASGRAMNNLIKDVNYIAALDTDEFPPSPSLFRISELQKEVLRGLGHSNSDGKVEFRVVPDIPIEIRTDRNFLRQILTNLLEIWTGAGCRGRASIEINIRKVDDSSASMELKVHLQGIGYTQSQLDEMLRFPFVQRQYASAGLRLAISRRFAEMLGGKLDVRLPGSEDLCATVSINIGTTSAPSSSPDTAPADGISSLGVKILAVDDDLGSREVITLMLKALGAEVQTASDGAEALKILKDKPGFDIVLMDCEMPGLNGYDAVKELRKREGESGGHATVIAMTGYTTPQDERRCFEAGMDAFLPKPLIIEDLRTAILKHVRR